MADKPFLILFVAPRRIGDAVLASGLLKRLYDEIPAARFTIAAGAEVAPLFADTPDLDELIIVEETEGHTHWLSLWSKTWRRDWGLIVDLRGSPLAGFLRRKKRATLRRKPHGPVTHKVVEFAGVLNLEDDPPAPFLFTDAETDAAAALHLGVGGPILAVAPGASWVGKAWPPERFAEIAGRLLGPGGPLATGRLLIVGTSADREAGLAVRLATSRDRIVGEPGQLGLLMTYACLKRARLFIGNESAAMHMAAAAGAPTMGLLGPTDDLRCGPWGPTARVVRGPREFEMFLKSDPDLNLAVCHMLDLSTDRVMAAAVRLLGETGAADG
jgi:ADP-heptose:LPS heptosyltransferase